MDITVLPRVTTNKEIITIKLMLSDFPKSSKSLDTSKVRPFDSRIQSNLNNYNSYELK